VGLRFVKLFAGFTVFFDHWIIDGVVDNTAYGVRGLGRLGAVLQSGRLQQYLAMMMTFLALILALVWFV
jgi:multicomponent Na+:H+ antiporter subunit D